MHSSRRPTHASTTSSFSSISSINTYLPKYRKSSPVALRQLVVRDLDEGHSTNWNRSPTPSRQRESMQTPNLVLPIPRASLHMLRDERLRPIDRQYVDPEEILPTPNPHPEMYVIGRPFYRIVTPPPTPPPPPAIQYRFAPVVVKQPLPIRTYRRWKEKKYRQERTPGLCTTLFSGGFASFIALLYLIILLALPTTKLVLGTVYLQQCPIQTYIPLYMIISGSAGLAIIVFLLLSSTCAFCRSSTVGRKMTHRCMIGTTAFARGMQGVLALFLFVWFFFGNAWVFSVRARVQTDRPAETTTYCHPALYWFAFYVLIFTYVLAVLMCFWRFCLNFFCCRGCDIWKRAFS